MYEIVLKSKGRMGSKYLVSNLNLSVIFHILIQIDTHDLSLQICTGNAPSFASMTRATVHILGANSRVWGYDSFALCLAYSVTTLTVSIFKTNVDR